KLPRLAICHEMAGTFLLRRTTTPRLRQILWRLNTFVGLLGVENSCKKRNAGVNGLRIRSQQIYQKVRYSRNDWKPYRNLDLPAQPRVHDTCRRPHTALGNGR